MNCDWSYTYENITMKKFTTQQKKTEEKNNRNEVKHSWPKRTCVVIWDSPVAVIDEHKMSRKHLVKVRTSPGVTCPNISLCGTYSWKKKKQTMWHCILELMMPIMKEYKLLTDWWSLNHLLRYSNQQYMLSHLIMKDDLKHLAREIENL